MSDETTVPQILEQIAEIFCDHYCKYPDAPIPEGMDEDWLFTSDTSPCNTCPIRFL